MSTTEAELTVEQPKGSGRRYHSDPEHDPPASRVLYRTFDNGGAYLADMYKELGRLYRLPTVSHFQRVRSATLFRYATERSYFVLVVPYTANGKILVERIFAANELSWGLVGGGIKPKLDDNFVDAVERTVSRNIDGLQLGEVEPITFVENTFEFGGRQHVHRGVAFVARVRHRDPETMLRQLNHTRTELVDPDQEDAHFGLDHHQAIVRAALPRIREARLFTSQEEEVAVNQQYQHRYKFHGSVVKPLFRMLGRVGFPHTLQDLNARIDDLITANQTTSLLDVACGENPGHVELAASGRLSTVVCNDISWSQVQLIRDGIRGSAVQGRLGRTESLLMFTNHDARRLPFADGVFDVAVCKNVLHHMPDQSSAQSLIDEMRRVARRSIIVEVLDPQYESLWGRVRHRYYMDFLKDGGLHFLSRDAFEKLTRSPDRSDMFEMATIRGIYQFAVFDSHA